MNKEYTRDELLEICEKAFVHTDIWHDRDSYDAQCQLGECYALLKDGCEFKVLYGDNLKTDDHTIWIRITSTGFAWFEYDGAMEQDVYYLPTLKRLEEADGGDWY